MQSTKTSEGSEQESDSQDLVTNLRSALRRMPSAVALITTRDPVNGAPAGLAASSVIPVSLEPPSMLISINRKASAHSVIERSGRFCVNLLGADQTTLLRLFSNSAMRAERFASDAWDERNDLPYLSEAPASIFCKVCATLLFGTHELFIGEVFDLHSTSTSEPLGWIEGNFATARPFKT